MPVEIQDGDTINRVYKPRWQAQRDGQQLNGIVYSKGSHENVFTMYYTSVSQPLGRGPVPGPGINYTGLREVLLEFVILVF